MFLGLRNQSVDIVDNILLVLIGGGQLFEEAGRTDVFVKLLGVVPGGVRAEHVNHYIYF